MSDLQDRLDADNLRKFAELGASQVGTQTPEQPTAQVQPETTPVAVALDNAPDEIPEWGTPSHEQIDLTTVTHEDLGLDPYDYDNPLVKKIYKAQETQAAAPQQPNQPETTVADNPLTPFEQRALPLIARNVPVIPLRPKTKIAFISGWEDKATTDPTKVKEWGQQSPDANVASVAKAVPGGTWFFDADRAELIDQVEKITGQKFPSTFMVRSQPGKGHYYFVQNAASIAMRNRQAKDQQGELWSARVNDRYVVGPLSLHPDTGKLYEVINDAPIIEAPQWLIDYCIQNDAKTDKPKTGHAELDDESPIVKGSRNNALASILGKARQHLAMDKDQLFAYGLDVNQKRCRPPLPDHEVRTIANSVGRYEVKPAVPAKIGGYAQVVESSAQTQADAAIEASQDAEGTFPFGEAIPDFDDAVITGNFRKLVDAICRGTTIPRQYGLHAAKALACSILTQHKVQFEDCESARAYFIVFGDTGTGKGLTFRRLQKIVDISQNQELFVKIIHAVDSEAGLRDAFFEIPTNKNIPILFFVDEIKTLGHKADGKKNPEITDAIVELANNPTVSRTKSKKTVAGAASKNRSDSWLLLYACAQDGEAYGMAFPRTKAQGLPDRFIPEYSPKIVPGRLPEPDMNLGIEAIAEMHRNAFKNQKMVMAADVKTRLDEIWSGQPEEFQKSPRLLQQFILEMYLEAFNRGSAMVQMQDLEIAVKALERQKTIRAKFFTEEIPNQVGVYSNRLKAVHREMMRRLRRGVGIGDVALSLPQMMTQTLAYKENDLPNFNQAWKAQNPFWVEIPVKSKNGHTYQKFVPTPEETDTWLPVELIGGSVLG
jgi:hypothetical protein